MNITATLNGEVVSIVQLSVEGSRLWINYVDSEGVLKVTKKNLKVTTDHPFVVVADNATIN